MSEDNDAGTTAKIPGWMERLDDDQRKVAGVRAPVVMVKGGPGAGKTRTMIARIINLTIAGQDPERIAVVTFTRQAAFEVLSRVHEAAIEYPIEGAGARALADLAKAIEASKDFETRSIDAPRKPWIGTFHNMCGRILRTTPEVIGWPEQIRTVGPEEAIVRAKAVLRQVRAEQGGTNVNEALDRNTKQLLGAMGERKKAGLRHEIEGPTAAPVSGVLAPRLARDWTVAAQRIDWKARTSGAADYDDLVAGAWQILNHDAHAALGWQKRWDHIMIDEAQDCDAILLELVARIAGSAELYVGGDPDQRIFGWAKAVQSFEEIEARLGRTQSATIRIDLRNDYRGCRTVQRATQALREHLADPGPRPRDAKREGYAPAQYVHYKRQADEEKGLAHRVKLVLSGAAGDAEEGGRRSELHDCLVVGRTHDACASAAKALAEERIPVWLDNTRGPRGPSACMAAWLIAAATHEDAAIEAAFELGSPSIKSDVLERVKRGNQTLGQKLRNPEARERLPERARERAEHWAKIANASELDGEVAAQATLNAIITTIGAETIQDPKHERTFQQDLALARKSASQGMTLEGLARSFAERTREGASGANTPSGHVRVCTMHSVKGSERRHVWAIGWVGGKFPLPYSKDLEEERRLALTAVSRAQRTFEASGYQIGHDGGAHEPSPFVREAKLAVVEGE